MHLLLMMLKNKRH